MVFIGLVASTKTLCSAPCLLNRAQLIWVCLGLQLSSLGRPSACLCLPVSPSVSSASTLATCRLAQGHSGHVTEAHISRWKEVLTFAPQTRLTNRLMKNLFLPSGGIRQTPADFATAHTLPVNIGIFRAALLSLRNTECSSSILHTVLEQVPL